jgi:hypothetical protein
MTSTRPPEARRAQARAATHTVVAKGLPARIGYLERWAQVLTAEQRAQLRAIADGRAET